MQILDSRQIENKIKRLAYQILEQYIAEKQLYLVGINNNGSLLRGKINEAVRNINPNFKTIQKTLRLSPADPIAGEIKIDVALKDLSGQNILIVDDVANTGRTLFYAATIFKDTLVKSIRTCVLVDRKHKSFPIKVDFVGLSLATTMSDDILVDLKSENRYCATLD